MNPECWLPACRAFSMELINIPKMKTSVVEGEFLLEGGLFLRLRFTQP